MDQESFSLCVFCSCSAEREKERGWSRGLENDSSTLYIGWRKRRNRRRCSGYPPSLSASSLAISVCGWVVVVPADKSRYISIHAQSHFFSLVYVWPAVRKRPRKSTSRVGSCWESAGEFQERASVTGSVLVSLTDSFEPTVPTWTYVTSIIRRNDSHPSAQSKEQIQRSFLVRKQATFIYTTTMTEPTTGTCDCETKNDQASFALWEEQKSPSLLNLLRLTTSSASCCMVNGAASCPVLSSSFQDNHDGRRRSRWLVWSRRSLSRRNRSHYGTIQSILIL